MPPVESISLAVLLVAIGLVFLAVVRLASRFVPRLQEERQSRSIALGEGLLEDHSDAVIVVETGGRVQSMNPRARRVFRLQDDETPNLERLARRVRPGDALLRLCAGEGQARFVLEGRLVEGTSYRLDDHGRQTTVVSLRHPEIATGRSGTGETLSAQTLQTFTELTQGMSASLNVEETLSAILENVEKLVPADFMEIAIWDEPQEILRPYRFLHSPGENRRLAPVEERSAASAGFSVQLVQQRRPLLIGDLQAREDRRYAVSELPASLRSYLGVPLLHGSVIVGTLASGALAPNTFREEDLELVRLLAGPAAIAIQNALAYRAEQLRSTELSGLARLAHAFTSARDPDSAFAHLVESLIPLVPVEVIGFLVYQESTRTLSARAPFHGLPAPVVELFRAEIPAGSPADQVLNDQDLLLCEDAASNEQWSLLGLSKIAQAASLRETALVPLSSGGRFLGYLQASNHTGGVQPFRPGELQLLSIVANQAASIIENEQLIDQSRRRAQRAEALRRVSNLASSAATMEEVLAYSIQDLGRLLRSDMGAIALLNPEGSELRLHEKSLFGDQLKMPGHAICLPVDEAQFGATATGSGTMLLYGSLRQQPAAGPVPFYQDLIQLWGVQSFIAVPLLVHNQSVGELWFGSRMENGFEPNDVQVAATAAGLLAGVVEQSHLRNQTDESLRRQVEQMVSLTRISRELSTSLDLNQLLQRVFEEALRATGADCGTILLFDRERPRLVRYYVGDPPRMELGPLECSALQQNAPVLAVDEKNAPYPAPHPGVQAVLVLPISHLNRQAGLMILHGRSAGQFDQPALEVAQSLAVQAAMALDNAMAYEEQLRRGAQLQHERDALMRLVSVSRALRPSQSLTQALTAVAQAIQSSALYQAVLISAYDPQTAALTRLVGVGLPPHVWNDLRARPQPWHSVAQLLRQDYRIGEAYYIPEDKTPSLPEDMHVVRVLPEAEQSAPGGWGAQDLLLVPLYDDEQHPLGLISVDAPSDQRRPDRSTFDALEVFAAQASLILESHRRANCLEQQLRDLSLERERLANAAASARANLPMMLHKELEQVVALRERSQRIERMRAVLEIAAQATRQNSEHDVLHTLAAELLTRFAMRAALIAEKTDAGVQLTEVLGSLPSGANPEALFGQRNPLRHMLQDRAQKTHDVPVLVANLDLDSEWQNNTLLSALEARSLIGISLDMGGGSRAAVLLIGQRALPPFLEEDRRIFAQLGYQVSLGIQNVQLLNETRRRLTEVDLVLDFSRKLGSLQPGDILAALLENVIQVIPEAQAGWVSMWDEREAALVSPVAVGYASNSEIQAITFSPAQQAKTAGETSLALPLRVYQDGKAERVAEVNFTAHYQLSAHQLSSYRRATNGRLPVSAMIIPLRSGETVLGILMLENFSTAAAFHEADEALASSFSRQAAMALENARLFQASQQRSAQLQSLTVVSGQITSKLQRETLIHTLLDQLRVVLPYETATLWLREGQQSLRVAAAAGFTDKEQRLNLAVAVQDSDLFQAMIRTRESISVGDLRSDSRFPSLIAPEHLSWLGIPLLYQNDVIGLIALEKREPHFYTADHIYAATTFASQAAVSLENARLFEESTARAAELDDRSQRLALLNQLSIELVSTLDGDTILQRAGAQLMAALDATGVAAVMIDAQGRYVLQAETRAQARNILVLPAAPILDHLLETQGIFQTSAIQSEPDAVPLWDAFLRERQACSLLVVPLISSTRLLGWLLAFGSTSTRYTMPEIELARTMCNQTAIAIQNAQSYVETRRLTEDLERRVEERTQLLRREHKNTETLLQTITELSTSLDMGMVLNRTLTVLNESLNSEESLLVLLQGTPGFYGAGTQLARTTENPAAALSVERQITRWVARTRAPLLIDRVQDDARWDCSAGPVAYQSVMAVPLLSGEQPLGALLLLHSAPAVFAADQAALVQAIARQISIALSNVELFTVIRDQSEHLGLMLREQQIEANRSRAILEAVADGVLVTDHQNHVTLLNASAESILNLSAQQILSQSLDTFSGLFGRSAMAWMATIQRWSQDPSASQGAETFAEQLDLENGRIVSVHLAPVFWRQEFFGTVSIFRDITHEVQVDRLKSEFVANVSHELRTPMTAIKGYVEIMLMGAAGELNQQQLAFLRTVKSNTDRLNILVDDLLNLSQIEAGKVALVMRPLDLREITAEVISDAELRVRDEEKTLQFVLDAAPRLPFGLGDAERVRQVLSNLVGNACNYTPTGGRITVRLRECGPEIQVDVQDNGIGVAPEMQERIFQRFYRGEDPLVLATAGTGLGLSIARTIVEMHHGLIWLESNGMAGQGSTFSFTLPVYHNQEGE